MAAEVAGGNLPGDVDRGADRGRNRSCDDERGERHTGDRGDRETDDEGPLEIGEREGLAGILFDGHAPPIAGEVTPGGNDPMTAVVGDHPLAPFAGGRGGEGRSPLGSGGDPHPKGRIGSLPDGSRDEHVVADPQPHDDLPGLSESGEVVEGREDPIGSEPEGQDPHQASAVENRPDGESQGALQRAVGLEPRQIGLKE